MMDDDEEIEKGIEKTLKKHTTFFNPPFHFHSFHIALSFFGVVPSVQGNGKLNCNL